MNPIDDDRPASRRLRQGLIALVGTCCRNARPIVIGALILTAALGDYAFHHIAMDTNTSHLFPPSLNWRQREIAFDKAFPQDKDLLVVVIDGPTSVDTDDAATKLAAELRKNSTLIQSVREPGSGAFFDRNGLLYLDPDELQKLGTRLAQVQPFLGTLAAHPGLNGLFNMIGDALDAVANGDVPAGPVANAFDAISGTTRSMLAGKDKPLRWQSMITGQNPDRDEMRRFLLVQPVLDYGALEPGGRASEWIRQAAHNLGLTAAAGYRVRLTGDVALSDQEFATIAEGAWLAAVVSLSLVTLLLFMAVKSYRAVLCILATLICGLVATSAFAAAAVGSLNVISVAFMVLFIGIAVDFGIQFGVRYMNERNTESDARAALMASAGKVGPSLTLAALACAVGFLSLVPTDYRGMAEMGIISGAGMFIALLLNLTLLPALLDLALPPAPGIQAPPREDRWLYPMQYRRPVIAITIVLAALGLAALPHLRFDADPLHLKNPRSESVATLYDLMGSPTATPFTIEVLTPSLAKAQQLARRLDKLPVVDKTLTLASFVPDNQDDKLETIDELSLLAGPLAGEISAAKPQPPGDSTEALDRALERLEKVPASSSLYKSASELAQQLARVKPQYQAVAAKLQRLLVSDLPATLKKLNQALQAEKITISSLPKSLRSDWIGTNNSARVEVFAKGNVRDDRLREKFAQSVLSVSPDATGPVISSIESGRTILHSFEEAGIIAVIAMTALLALVLRRLKSICLVFAPVFLSGLITAMLCVLIGVPLNFANVIALPLMLGIGVSFAIYFVISWRNGMPMRMNSPITRAVFFSAMTTGVAFGSLLISGHPGTASMGLLLSMSLVVTLISTLLLLPAMLGPPPVTGGPEPAPGD